ncbi:MAG: glycosyltransferase family 39 protein [Thermoanaerobaculaceae bacterium]
MTRVGEERAAALVALLGVMAAAAVLALTLPHVHHAADADEGVYLRYVQELDERGLGALPDLHARFVADRRLSAFPPPTRAGYLLLALAWCTLFGTSFGALSALSACCHVATTATTFLLARRHLDGWGSALLTWLVGCSPLWLALGRRALTDAPALLLASLAWWSFLAVLRRPASIPARLAFVFATAASLSVKELSVLLLVPLAVVFAWERMRGRTSLPLATLGWLLAAPLALAGVIGVVAAGGPDQVMEVARIVLASPADSAFVRAFCGGPWYRHVVDLLLVSPLTTLIGLGGVLTVAVRAVRSGEQNLPAAAAILIVVTLAEFAPLIKNVRYVALLDLPLRLLALGVLSDLAGGLGERWRRPALVAGVAVLVAADLVSFFELFVAGGIYDPTSFNLLAARQMIPVR